MTYFPIIYHTNKMPSWKIKRTLGNSKFVKKKSNMQINVVCHNLTYSHKLTTTLST